MFVTVKQERSECEFSPPANTGVWFMSTWFVFDGVFEAGMVVLVGNCGTRSLSKVVLFYERVFYSCFLLDCQTESIK